MKIISSVRCDHDKPRDISQDRLRQLNAYKNYWNYSKILLTIELISCYRTHLSIKSYTFHCSVNLVILMSISQWSVSRFWYFQRAVLHFITILSACYIITWKMQHVSLISTHFTWVHCASNSSSLVSCERRLRNSCR